MCPCDCRTSDSDTNHKSDLHENIEGILKENSERLIGKKYPEEKEDLAWQRLIMIG